MSDLEVFLREGRRVFSICPQCQAIHRLSELALSRDGSFVPDWKDAIDAETLTARREQMDLQAREKALKTEALRKAQSERIPQLLEKAAPTFARKGIDARDVRILVEPTEFVEFRGYTAERPNQIVRFLHLGPRSEIQKSIADAISARNLGWKTAHVDPEGNVTMQEPTERVKKKTQKVG